MRTLSIAIFCLGSLSFGCGTTVDPGGPIADGHVLTDGDSIVDGDGSVHEACVTDLDCKASATNPPPNGAFNTRVCAYKISDGCSATGHCYDIPQPTCASFTYVCGCGKQVPTGSCTYPDGYAGGPSTGDTSCADGGPMQGL